MKRPWANRAEELLPAENTYADYQAWGEWFDSQLPDADNIRENLGGLNDVNLYCIFCGIFDAMPDMPEFVEIRTQEFPK